MSKSESVILRFICCFIELNIITCCLFISKVSFAYFIAMIFCVLFLFVITFCIDRTKLPFFLFLMSFMYLIGSSIYSMTKQPFSVIIFSFVILGFILIRYDILKDLDKIKIPRYFLPCLVIMYFVLGILVYHALYKNGGICVFDTGIFLNYFGNFVKGNGFVSRTITGELVNHMRIHFSPFWYIFAGMFYIFRNIYFIFSIPIVMSIATLIPLRLLCKRYDIGKRATSLICLVWLCNPYIATRYIGGLTENMMCPFFFLMLFYLMDTNAKIWKIVLCLLSIACIKEDIGIWVTCMGVFYLARGNKRGWLLTIFGGVSFVVTPAILYSLPRPESLDAKNGYIGRWFSSCGDSIKDVGINVIFNFTKFIRNSFTEDKQILQDLVVFFMGFGFIPFITKNWHKFILLLGTLYYVLPDLSSGAFDGTRITDFRSQYLLPFSAFLIYLTVLNYKDMENTLRKKILVLISCIAIISMTHNTVGIYEHSDSIKLRTEYYKEAEEFIHENYDLDNTFFSVATVFGDMMYAKNLCYIYKGDNINELDVIIRDKSMFSEDIVVENFNTVFENECVIILQRSDYSR